MKLHPDFDLTSYNTFGIAAKAAIFLVIEGPEDVEPAIKLHGIPQYVLGGGSNLVITKDIPWVVWHITYDSMIQEDASIFPATISPTESHIFLTIWAWMKRHDLVMHTIRKSLRGIENLIAIPWSVWAAPVQNIGAYWVELQDVCASVQCYDTEKMKHVKFSCDDCHFAYRHSIFKEQPWRYIIYSVTLKLSLQSHPILTYKPVAEAFADKNPSDIEQAEIASFIETMRWSKLPNPIELWNSGSFFQNPILSRDRLNSLLLKYPTMPHYPQPPLTNWEVNHNEKISAARLIDNSNLKWYREWQVGTYPLQPLVIVQYGWATGQDILNFSERIIQKVQESFGITLQREVNIR